VTFAAKNDSVRAGTFGNKLIDRALGIAAFPELGRVVPELGTPNIREIIHGSYRLIYEFFPERETIYLLRFWHSARGKPEIQPTP
jgi:plasmid stabilization system protein ParE